MRKNYTDLSTYQDFIKNCTDHFFYKFFNPGEFVFHYGQIGVEFYIILSGRVGIFIPKTAEDINNDFERIKEDVLKT